MYIYVDILAGINFILNGLILFLTGYFNCFPCNLIRLFLTTLLSVGYLLIGLTNDIETLNHPLMKFIFSYLLIYMYFGKKPFKTTCVLLGTFYFISFVFGGAVLGFLFLLQSDPTIFNLKNVSINFRTLSIGIICACGLLFFIFKPVYHRYIKKSYLYKVRLHCDQKEIHIMALLDTGNHLYTMDQKYPVIIVNKRNLTSLFPPEIQSFITKPFLVERTAELEDFPNKAWLKRMYFIPYKGIGKGNLLLGFRPDFITIENTNICCDQVVVGIYDGSLSSFGEYEGLLHLSLFKNIQERG